MKKFIKNIAKTLSILLMFAIVCLPLSACSKNKNASKSPETSVENISTDTNIENVENADLSEPTEDNSNEEQEPNDEPEEEKITLNGIYKVSKEIDYKDIWYEDETETIKFFETRDVNGVYNALRKLNFKENTTFKTTINETTFEVMFRFTETNVYNTIAINNDVYLDIIETTYDSIHKIEIDETGNIFAYIQFTYTNDNNEIVKTPAYIKCPLTIVEHSENVMVGANYIYKQNSAIVKFSNDSKIDNETALNKLAEMFEIEETSEDKLSDIVAILSTRTYNLSTDLSKLTIIDIIGSYQFSALNGDVYTFNALNLKLESRQINITTNIEKLVFSIVIDENSTLEFTCIAV